MTKQIVVFLAALLATATAYSQVVSDGGGTLTLTSNMIRSGTDAAHPNVYQNYINHNGNPNGAGIIAVSDVQHVVITKCDFGSTSAASMLLFLNNLTDVSITNCTFHDAPNCNGIGTYPTPLINVHIDNNTFTNLNEPIHLDFGKAGDSAGNTINSNYINGYGRIGIELQDAVNGLKVLNNYITNRLNPGSDSGMMAISCATGCPMSQGATANKGVDTHNVEIAHNVLIGPAWYSGYDFAIEDYGSGSNVHDNYIQHWRVGIGYCWTGVSGQVPWSFSNNKLIDVPGGLSNDEGFGQKAGFPEVTPTTKGNAVFAAGAGPAIPSVAATIGGTTTTTQPATQPASFKASAATDGIHLSSLPAAGGTLTWTATGDSGAAISDPAAGQTNSVTIPAGQTAYVDQTVPNNWEVIYTFSAAPSATVLVRAATNQTFTSTVTSTQQPATQPALTHTLQVFSDGTVSVDGVIAK